MESPLKVYNASAGSGKTYTLVKDILEYVLSDKNPRKFQEILAMTFTNKAAQEMKTRILKELRVLSGNVENSPYKADFIEIFGVTEEELRKRAFSALREIIHNYSLFNVGTIDTFNLRLMRSFAKDMGLSFNFDVEMETDRVIDDASNLFFSELEEGSRITDIIGEVAISKMEASRSWDISSELVKQAKNSFQDEFRDEMEKFYSIGIEKLEDYRRNVVKEYFAIKKQIGQMALEGDDIIKKSDLDASFFFQGKRGVFSYFSKNKNEVNYPNNFVLAFFEDEKMVSSKATNQEKERIEAIFPDLKNVYLKMLKAQIRHDLLDRIYRTINSLILLSELNENVERLRNEGNFLLISDFNKTISEHLQAQPANFIYEKLGIRFKKFFIDEFQDTSSTQWNNLYPLIEDALAQNNKVSLVGDPKQSIYRFRGGDVKLMTSLMKGESYPVNLKQLDTNYRSAEEIVNFTNDFFTEMAGELPSSEFKEIYIEGNHQKTNKKKGGYVRIELCDNEGTELTSKENQLEHMYLQIERLREVNYPYSDIAILCRTRAEAVLVSEFLKSHQIPVISNESLLLVESPSIQILHAFLKVFAEQENEEFRFDLLSLLKGIGVFSEEEFAPFVVKNKSNDVASFFKSLSDYGYELNLDKLQNFSLYDLVESVVRIFGIEEEEAYVIKYLDEVLRFQQRQKGNVIEWLDYFEMMSSKLSINLPSGSNAVLVMTIHKSKGLEFPIVMLPFVDWGEKVDGVWVDLRKEDVNRIYIEKVSDPKYLPTEIREKIEEEEAMAKMDQFNVFYVATTRAEKQLYIFSNYSKKRTKWLHDILSKYVEGKGDSKLYEKGVFTPYVGNKNESAKEEEKIKLQNRTEPWQDKILVSTEHSDLESNRDISRITGSQIHAILEKIQDKYQSEKTLDKLQIKGLINQAQREEVVNYLNQIYSHPKVSAFYERKKNFNERDFISKSGEIFRPDRLVEIEAGKWVVIDYKTGKREKSHIAQVTYYATELKELGYTVVGKYLIYLGEEVLVDEIE